MCEENNANQIGEDGSVQQLPQTVFSFQFSVFRALDFLLFLFVGFVEFVVQNLRFFEKGVIHESTPEFHGFARYVPFVTKKSSLFFSVFLSVSVPLWLTLSSS